MERWVDYYSVLQVHPLAEDEVIQSAYKRLCRKYHPDVNKSAGAADKIAEINNAYEVLGDAAARRKYYLEWKTKNPLQTPRVEVRERVVYVRDVKPQEAQGNPYARKVIEEYFAHVSAGRFREAFSLISETDKRSFTLGSYVEWQDAVAAMYELLRCDVRFLRSSQSLKMDDGQRFPAEEYSARVSEKTRSTGCLSEYSITKYAICENGVWRVYLGYKDLMPFLMRFKTMAVTQEEALWQSEWQRYKEHHDISVGLLNKKGFSERFEPEAYRARRYRRPFSVAVLMVNLPRADENHKAHILKYIGYIVSNTVRNIDVVAYLDSARFGIVLSETEYEHAEAAARRILRVVRHDVAACFDFELDMSIGVCEFKGDNIDLMIDSCIRAIQDEKTTRTGNMA